MENEQILLIDDICLDFQPEENLIEDAVVEYVERIKAGEQIEPIRVRFDGVNYFCEDGFHRIEALKRLGIAEIEAEVSPGSLADVEAEFQEHLKQLKKKLAERP